MLPHQLGQGSERTEVVVQEGRVGSAHIHQPRLTNGTELLTGGLNLAQLKVELDQGQAVQGAGNDNDYVNV